MVYFVCKQCHCNTGETTLKLTYHSKLLFTFCAVFKTPDGGSSGLIRVFDEGGVSILVVVIVIVAVIRFLCFGLSFCFQFCLGSFGELRLLWFQGFLWFI